jgi:hypothetical protein
MEGELEALLDGVAAYVAGETEGDTGAAA